MPEEFHERHLEGFKHAVETGKGPLFGRHQKLLGMGKDGREVPFEVSLSAYSIKGEPFFTAIIRDITERKRYEEKLEALHRHATMLDKTGSMEEIAEITLDTLESVFGYHGTDFAEVEEHVLRLVDTRRREDVPSRAEVPFDGEGLVVEAARTGSSILVTDVRNREDYYEARSKTLSELVIPVKVDGEAAAVINIESEELDAFTEQDQRLVEILAKHVSSTIERIDYGQRLQALEVYSNELHKTSSVEEIAETTVAFITQVLGYNRTGLGLVDGDVIHPVMLGEPGVSRDIHIHESSVIARAVRTSETQLVPDTREDPDYLPYDEAGDTVSLSELAVPVKDSERVIGVINIESKELDAYGERDQRLMELFAEHAASTIGRLQYQEKLERTVEERTEELRQAYEDLKEFDRMKDQFMTMATHELRTPLTSIKGYVDYIKTGSAGEVPEKINDLLEVVERNTRRLETITDDLLDQQRLQSGEMDIAPESLQLSDVVEEVVEEVEPMLEEKNQVLEVRVPEELSRVEADRTRISQVLVNLLNNAWKFSPEETSISLEVREEEDRIKICIEDEGMGLSEEDMEELFEPFPQIERPTVTEKSTGLGLSICKGIVELHGGEIWAESEGKGEGTTFNFTLPKTSDNDEHSE